MSTIHYETTYEDLISKEYIIDQNWQPERWRWKRRFPRTYKIRGRRTKEIDALIRDTEDEGTKNCKRWRQLGKTNENTLTRSSPPYNYQDNYLSSLPENEESTSDVDIKELTKTTVMATNNERMKLKIEILKQDLKL